MKIVISNIKTKDQRDSVLKLIDGFPISNSHRQDLERNNIIEKSKTKKKKRQDLTNYETPPH